jgi:hypothetical protein
MTRMQVKILNNTWKDTRNQEQGKKEDKNQNKTKGETKIRYPGT